jgi:hypothetical protein
MFCVHEKAAMQIRDSKTSPTRSKTLATWLAIIGGSLGIHRFYLYGFRDLPGWLHPLPSVIGFFGVLRMRSLGQDDQLAWLLTPLLGCSISAAMLAAIVYGLMPDEKWNARFNVDTSESRSGWGAVLGAMLALLVGACVLMSTIAFVAQRYFEYQAETDVTTPVQSPASTPPPASR